MWIDEWLSWVNDPWYHMSWNVASTSPTDYTSYNNPQVDALVKKWTLSLNQAGRLAVRAPGAEARRRRRAARLPLRSELERRRPQERPRLPLLQRRAEPLRVHVQDLRPETASEGQEVEGIMRVLRYTLRRLLFVVPVLAAALFLTFALTRIVPGNPIDRVAGPYMSNEQRAALKHQAYLDRPFYTQFALYVRDLVHGKMGVSYTTAQDVSKDLRQRFPASFELVTYAMLIAVLTAVPLGIAAAIKKDSSIDHVARVVRFGRVHADLLAGADPPLPLLLQVRVVPRAGRADRIGDERLPRGDRDPHARHAAQGELRTFWAVVKALALPCFTLGFVAMAPIARFTRATMAEVLEADYIRTARSLGLPFRVVIGRLGLKNALIGILTIIAAVYGYALGGEVLVEIIFNWPGLGQYSYNAILSSDFPAIQGFVLLVTSVYMIIYLAARRAHGRPRPSREVLDGRAMGRGSGSGFEPEAGPPRRRPPLGRPLPVPRQPGDDRRHRHPRRSSSSRRSSCRSSRRTGRTRSTSTTPRSLRRGRIRSAPTSTATTSSPAS